MNCKKCHIKMIFKRRLGSIRHFRCPGCNCVTIIEDGKKRKDYYANICLVYGPGGGKGVKEELEKLYDVWSNECDKKHCPIIDYLLHSKKIGQIPGDL